MTDPRRHTQEDPEKRGHNHPASQKCDQHCPRNERYRGHKKKLNPFRREA